MQKISAHDMTPHIASLSIYRLLVYIPQVILPVPVNGAVWIEGKRVTFRRYKMIDWTVRI